MTCRVMKGHVVMFDEAHAGLCVGMTWDVLIMFVVVWF